MGLKDKVVLLWVICLWYKVVMIGCEVVWVNRNVTDSFRVGQDGCTNDTSVCTNVFATCQDDGSCLCSSKSPSFRNPVIEVTGGKLMYGSSYGCIKNDNIRTGDILGKFFICCVMVYVCAMKVLPRNVCIICMNNPQLATKARQHMRVFVDLRSVLRLILG